VTSLVGKLKSRGRINAEKTKGNHMGDKSPKSNQKKSTQKQSKSSSADKKKQQAVASKQVAGKKK
jgi:hypothetical protein